MRRREFITLVGGIAVSPLSARAQQSEQIRCVGVLLTFAEDDSEEQAAIAAFLQRMLGWTNGRNLRIDTLWSAGNDDKMRKNVAEFVALVPDVVLAMGSSVGPLLQASSAVPVVFVSISDPVGAGYVNSLARPGGNATGFLSFEYGISGKWLELLKQIAPTVTRVGVIRDPRLFGAVQSVAASFGVETSAINVRDASEIERAITALAATSSGGLIVTASASAQVYRNLIIATAARHKLPAIYFNGRFVADGGLISYGPDFIDQYRSAAESVDRILKGEKPADLPVQAPTKYNLAINLKTAKALGLSVPQSVLGRADEVIE